MTPFEWILSSPIAIALAITAAMLDVQLNSNPHGQKATVLGAFGNLFLIWALLAPFIAAWKLVTA